MSAVTDLPYAPPEGTEFHPYRAVSRAAIVSLVLGVLSVGALLFATLLIIPLVGLVLGLVALSTIRRYPAEYTGGRLALAGTILGAVLFVGGAAWHTYVFATEVPEGYARTGFWELQPDPDHPEYFPVSKRATELAGKEIFIKGYMHPGVASMGKVDHFILVPDMGTCCFGGDPKSTDMIEVIMRDDKKVKYNQRQRKIAGVFRVDPYPRPVPGMKNGVFYQIDAEYAK